MARTAAESSTPPVSNNVTIDAPLNVAADRDTVARKTSPSLLQKLNKSLEAYYKEYQSSIESWPLAGTIGEAANNSIANEHVVKSKTTNSAANQSLQPSCERQNTRTGESATHGPVASNLDSVNMEGSHVRTATGSRGRSRGPGRPRGSGRGRGAASGRGGKRKREHHDDDDDDDDNDSDSSEVYTPVATTTKSGRSIQKPSAYVPPPQQSPPSSKRRRMYRRNPESAVCKICLRGTSPTTNMIVFCDGCNIAYHRYCHQPPIPQAVVDEVEMEWYCKQCERERFVPPPAAEVASFVSAEGSSLEQRRKYFSSLMPGLLVTLLLRATTIHPDLPLFDPEFGAKHSSNASTAPPPVAELATPNGVKAPHTAKPSFTSEHGRSASNRVHEIVNDEGGNVEEPDADDDGYHESFHPPHYPRPGQGLMKTLPPDKDDERWLVDNDDQSGTFTHVYRMNPAAANPTMRPTGS